MLRRLAKTEVLILDDFGLEVLTAAQRKDLLEVLEDRYGVSSTIVTSQLEPSHWHSVIGDETIAEPGLEVPHPRLAERAFVLEPLLELDPSLRLPDGRPLRELHAPELE